MTGTRPKQVKIEGEIFMKTAGVQSGDFAMLNVSKKMDKVMSCGK